jgi:cytochrome P450
VASIALPPRFLRHDSRERLLSACGLDAASIRAAVLTHLSACRPSQSTRDQNGERYQSSPQLIAKGITIMTATYDLLSPAHFAAPYETFALMRENDPLYWHEQMGLWFVTRYQDVHAVMRDRRFSANRVKSFMPPGTDEKTQAVRQFFTDWMVFNDPPEHTRLRKLFSRVFSPRSVAMLEHYVRLVAQEALDRVKDQDQIDIIRDFGFRVPSQVIARMLGVASDRVDDFEQWSHAVLRLIELLGDPEENVAVRAKEDGTVLSDHELIAHCVLFLSAGHETTTNLIGNATLALLRNPAEQARLRSQPELAASAVEEFARYDPAVAGLARTAKEDVRIGGGVVPAGATVMAVVPAANRDPAVFTDPDRLDLGRGDMRHLGFGGGPHACIGGALARLETRIAMNALLAAFPRMELAVSQPEPLVGWAIRGVTSLPVNVG